MFGFDSTYILLHRVCLWVNLAYKDRTPWMLAKMLGFDQWPTFVIDTNSDFSWADNHQVSVTPTWCHFIVVVWSLKTGPWFRFTQLIFKTSTHPRTHTHTIYKCLLAHIENSNCKKGAKIQPSQENQPNPRTL